MSLLKNCPGMADRIGNVGAKTLGVVSRKLSVIPNVIAAITLPIADTNADQG